MLVVFDVLCHYCRSITKIFSVIPLPNTIKYYMVQTHERRECFHEIKYNFQKQDINAEQACNFIWWRHYQAYPQTTNYPHDCYRPRTCRLVRNFFKFLCVLLNLRWDTYILTFNMCRRYHSFVMSNSSVGTVTVLRSEDRNWGSVSGTRFPKAFRADRYSSQLHI